MACPRKEKEEGHEVAPHDPTLAELNIFHVQARTAEDRGIAVEGGRLMTFVETGWRKVTKEKAGCDHDVEVQVLYPPWLGSFHQGVLLAILAIAAKQSPSDRNYVPCLDTDSGMDSLAARLDASIATPRGAPDRISVTTKAGTLLSHAGMSASKRNYERLHDILRDLSRVNCGYRWNVNPEKKTKSTASEGLLSYAYDSDRRLIKVSLSARMSRMFMASRDGSLIRYLATSLTELNDLEGDVARLLYTHLSRLVREGEVSMRLRPDTLMNLVYLDPPKDSAEASRRRREIRKGLCAIDRLNGWRISEYTDEAAKKGPKDRCLFISRTKRGIGPKAGGLLLRGESSERM